MTKEHEKSSKGLLNGIAIKVCDFRYKLLEFPSFINKYHVLEIKKEIQNFRNIKSLDDKTKKKLVHITLHHKILIYRKRISFYSFLLCLFLTLFCLSAVSCAFLGIRLTDIFLDNFLNAKNNVESVLFYLILYLFFTSILFSVSLFFIKAIRIFIENQNDLKIARIYPDSIIVDKLLDILIKLEKSQLFWNTTDFRKSIIDDLEKVAVHIENNLSYKFRTDDIKLDLWQKDIAKQIAASIRLLKRWVFTPKTDTRIQLIDKISFIFSCAACGNWDSLDRTPIDNISFVEVFRSRSIILGKKFLVIILPIFLFWVFQKTPFSLQGDLYNYVCAVIFIIAILIFLMEFDSDFSARISTLKELSSILAIPVSKDKK